MSACIRRKCHLRETRHSNLEEKTKNKNKGGGRGKKRVTRHRQQSRFNVPLRATTVQVSIKSSSRAENPSPRLDRWGGIASRATARGALQSVSGRRSLTSRFDVHTPKWVRYCRRRVTGRNVGRASRQTAGFSPPPSVVVNRANSVEGPGRRRGGGRYRVAARSTEEE